MYYLNGKEDVLMKKKALVFIMVVCIGFAIAPFDTANAQAKPIRPITLTYNNFFPAAHIQSKLAQTWCQEVYERTNGKVIVEHHPGQKLTPAAEVYEGVVQGKSDLGFSLLPYTAERFPVMGAVDLPLGYTSGKVATAVANEVYRKFKPKELSDTKVMYLHAHGPGVINTRGKAVRRMEDMKGLRLRTHGTTERMVAALGGVPVRAPMPQLAQMLKKGVVFGAIHPVEALDGWKLAEWENYFTACYAISNTSTFYVVMNKDTWNALPKEYQVIIDEINNEWVVQHGEAWDTSDAVGLRVFLNKGSTVIGLSAKEAARWKRAVAPIIKDHVKYLNKQGLNGQEIVDFTINTLNKMQ